MSEEFCFVIGPIGSEDSEDRKRADDLFELIIQKTLNEYKIKAIRADRINETGLITQQIINHIKNSKFIIADLHNSNPNVFYELALSHALNKNVIQFYTAGQRLPFDVQDLRSIKLDMTNIRSYENAKKALHNQIQAVLNNPRNIQNPFSISVDLQQLSNSDHSYERTTVLLFDRLESIENKMIEALNQYPPINKIYREDKDNFVIRLKQPKNKIKSLINLTKNKSMFDQLIIEYKVVFLHCVNISDLVFDKQLLNLIEYAPLVSDDTNKKLIWVLEQLKIDVEFNESDIVFKFPRPELQDLLYFQDYPFNEE